MDMDPSLLLAQLNDAHPPPSPASAVSPFLAGAVAANTPSHPSYVDMITAAIEWENSQGKEGGSSKRAIAKYIDRVYTNLPASHSALLTHHLQRLKNSGQLVMLKNSYQLSSALPPPPSPWPQPARSDAAADFSGSVEPTTAKRGRGRPPKQKVAVEMEFGPDPDMGIDNGFGSGSGSGSGSEQVKKRRGRPPRWTQEGDVATEVPFVQLISEVRPISIVNGDASSGGQKRRGRPPKVQAVEVEPEPMSFAPEEVHVNVNEETPVKRQRGRPPKNASSVVVMPERPDAEGSVRPRGRPRKNVLGPVVSTRPVGNRPRGRPKMMGGAVSGGADLRVGFGMGMRRGRGRPPKGLARRAGRPPGRPRKDVSILRNSHTAGQEVADEELLRKLELIQSKIREAVIVIRPCVADDSPALMALQQLEELATMDVPVLQDAPPSPPETMTIPQSDSGAPPTSAANVPFMGGPFTVNVAPMNVSAPFHGAPPGMETQHTNVAPMNWFSSNEA